MLGPTGLWPKRYGSYLQGESTFSMEMKWSTFNLLSLELGSLLTQHPFILLLTYAILKTTEYQKLKMKNMSRTRPTIQDFKPGHGYSWFQFRSKIYIYQHHSQSCYNICFARCYHVITCSLIFESSTSTTLFYKEQKHTWFLKTSYLSPSHLLCLQDVTST